MPTQRSAILRGAVSRFMGYNTNMFHYPKTLKEYKKNLGAASCPFCSADELSDRILAETEHAYIIPNKTAYDLWEVRTVVDHLLVIPKRHVRSLKELSPDERADIMNILADYEDQNYNVYARGKISNVRSVVHQHTHLIKTNQKEHRGTFFMRKPYIFFKF